jgi:hypothetical protein
MPAGGTSLRTTAFYPTPGSYGQHGKAVARKEETRTRKHFYRQLEQTGKSILAKGKTHQMRRSSNDTVE